MSEQDRKHSGSRRDFLRDGGKLALVAGAAVGAAHLAGPDAQAQVARGRDKVIVPGSASRSYSRAVKLDRLVFVAGCVGTYKKNGRPAIDPDFELQASQTLLNLKASVEAARSSLDRVLKCTCFLKNLGDFAKFNEIYLKFFPKDPPARSTVIVKDLVVPGALLEVDCVCYVG